MKDPKRLLDRVGDLDELELRALSAARDVRPSPKFAEQVWTGLLTKLPPGAGPGPDGSGGPVDGGSGAAGTASGAGSAGAAGAAKLAGASAVAAKSALTLAVVKSAAVGVVLGGAVAGGLVLSKPAVESPSVEGKAQSSLAFAAPAAEARTKTPRISRESSRTAPAHERGETASPSAAAVATPKPATAPRGVAELEERAHALGDPVARRVTEPAAERARSLAPVPEGKRFGETAPRTPGPASAPIQAAADPALALREESRFVTAGRDALQSGNSARALDLLEAARHKFPGGVLAQEREALFIEALAVSGDRTRAKQRGERFLQIYPTSPHAARVRALAR